MPDKINNKKLEQVSGGAWLEKGHVCKHCGKEFEVIHGKKSSNPIDMPLIPTKAVEEYIQNHYCFDCINNPDVKKEVPSYLKKIWGQTNKLV